MRSKRFGRFVSIDIHPRSASFFFLSSRRFFPLSIIFRIYTSIYNAQSIRRGGEVNRPTCSASISLNLFHFYPSIHLETPEEEFRPVFLFDPPKNH